MLVKLTINQLSLLNFAYQISLQQSLFLDIEKLLRQVQSLVVDDHDDDHHDQDDDDDDVDHDDDHDDHDDDHDDHADDDGEEEVDDDHDDHDDANYELSIYYFDCSTWFTEFVWLHVFAQLTLTQISPLYHVYQFFHMKSPFVDIKELLRQVQSLIFDIKLNWLCVSDGKSHFSIFSLNYYTRSLCFWMSRYH